MVSLLLCLEDEKAPTHSFASVTADRLLLSVETDAFASALWRALLRASRVRIPAMRLINKLIDPPLALQPQVNRHNPLSSPVASAAVLLLDLLLQPTEGPSAAAVAAAASSVGAAGVAERICVLLPDRPRLVIGALEAALADENHLVKREALDLLLHQLPLNLSGAAVAAAAAAAAAAVAAACGFIRNASPAADPSAAVFAVASAAAITVTALPSAVSHAAALAGAAAARCSCCCWRRSPAAFAENVEVRLIKSVLRLLPLRDWSLTRRAVLWLTAQGDKASDEPQPDLVIHVRCCCCCCCCCCWSCCCCCLFKCLDTCRFCCSINAFLGLGLKAPRAFVLHALLLLLVARCCSSSAVVISSASVAIIQTITLFSWTTTDLLLGIQEAFDVCPSSRASALLPLKSLSVFLADDELEGAADQLMPALSVPVLQYILRCLTAAHAAAAAAHGAAAHAAQADAADDAAAVAGGRATSPRRPLLAQLGLRFCGPPSRTSAACSAAAANAAASADASAAVAGRQTIRTGELHVVWRALAEQLRLVLQQQQQQQHGNETGVPSAAAAADADAWVAAETARKAAAAAAGGVLQLASLFADRLAAPLAAAAAASGAADAAAICDVQTLHGFAQLLILVLGNAITCTISLIPAAAAASEGCRELAPTLQQLPTIAWLLQQAAADVKRLRALKENEELLLLLHGLACAPPGTPLSAARAAAAAAAAVAAPWRQQSRAASAEDANAAAGADEATEASGVDDVAGGVQLENSAEAAEAAAAAGTSTEFAVSPDALQPSLQQLLRLLRQLLHAVESFFCFAEGLLVELTTTEEETVFYLDTLLAMLPALVELQCCIEEDIGVSSSSSSNSSSSRCLPSWLLALLDCVPCPRLSVCCKAAQTFIAVLNSSSSSRRQLICESDLCVRVACRLWEWLGSSSSSSSCSNSNSEGLVVDLLLQLNDACLRDRPGVVESVVLDYLQQGSSSSNSSCSSSKADSIWRFCAFWRHARLQTYRPLGVLMPNAVLELLASLGDTAPDVRYAARVFVRLALDTAPQLLRPVFECILTAPPPLQQQQDASAAAAAGSDAEAAAEAARRGLALLQLLLQSEGPLLLEKIQSFFVQEELLQLNAAQARLWSEAKPPSLSTPASGGAAATETAAAATTATATAAEGDWRSWTYDDLSVVDYADLFCVVLLRLISFQLPPEAGAAPAAAAGTPAVAADAAAAALNSSFAAVHSTACELLGCLLASVQPAARAREISCLLSHGLVYRLHAAVRAADYAAQSQLLQLLRVVIIHSNEGDKAPSPAARCILNSSNNEIQQLMRQQEPQRGRSTSSPAAAAAAAAAPQSASVSTAGGAVDEASAEGPPAAVAKQQQQQQQQQLTAGTSLSAEYPLFAVGLQRMKSKRLVPLSADYGALLRGLLLAMSAGETTAAAARDAAVEEATQLSLFLLQHLPASQLQPVSVVLLDFFCRLLLRAAAGRCAKSRPRSGLTRHSSSSSSSSMVTSRMLLPYLRGILGVLSFVLDSAAQALRAKDTHAETSGLTPLFDFFSWGGGSHSEEEAAQHRLQQQLPGVAASAHMIISACVAAANLVLPPVDQQQQQQQQQQHWQQRIGLVAGYSSRDAHSAWPTSGLSPGASSASLDGAAAAAAAATVACSPEQQQLSECQHVHLTHADEAALSLSREILERVFAGFPRGFALSCVAIWAGGLAGDGSNLRSLLLLLRLMQKVKLRHLLVPLTGLCHEAAKGLASTPASPSSYVGIALLHQSPFAAAEETAAAEAAAAAAAGTESLETLLSQTGCAETLKPRESVIYHLIYCLLIAASPPSFVSFECLCTSACRSSQKRVSPPAAAATAAAATAADSSTSTSSNETETEEIWRQIARLVSVGVSAPRQPVSILWLFCIVNVLDRVKPAKEHVIASKRELFRLSCSVACRCFSVRVSSAANPNAYDVLSPLPPPVDLVNQALAVPAATAAARRRQTAAASAAAEAAAGTSDSCSSDPHLSSSSSSGGDTVLLLQELQRRRDMHRRPSFSVSSCITEANREISRHNISASCSASADAAELAALFGLAALAMQCADLKQLNRRSPLSGLFLQTLTDEIPAGLAQALNNNSPQAFLSRYMLLSLVCELPLRLFPAAAPALRRLLLDGLQGPRFFVRDRRSLRAWGLAFRSILTAETSKLDALVPPPNPGVFASRDKEAASRLSHLKRVAFVLLAAPGETFVSQVAALLEKLTEALKAQHAQEAAVQVFVCVRVLLLRLPAASRTPVWPIVLTELIRVFSCLSAPITTPGALPSSTSGGPSPVASEAPPPPLLLAGLKVVELAMLLELPDFTLYRWVFFEENLNTHAQTSPNRMQQQQQQQQLLGAEDDGEHRDSFVDSSRVGSPAQETEDDEQGQQQQQKGAEEEEQQQATSKDVPRVLASEDAVQAAAAAAAATAGAASETLERDGAEEGSAQPDEAAAAAATAAAAAAADSADSSHTGGISLSALQDQAVVAHSSSSSDGSRDSSGSSRPSGDSAPAAPAVMPTFKPYLCLLVDRYEQQQKQQQQLQEDTGAPRSPRTPGDSAGASEATSRSRGVPASSSSSSSNSCSWRSLAAAARRLNQRAAAEPRCRSAEDDEEIQRSIEDDLLEGPIALRDMWLQVALPPLLQRQWCLYTSGFDMLLPAAAAASQTDALEQHDSSSKSLQP
ncbi:hypothetical protein Emed_003551 [Eimeria media]